MSPIQTPVRTAADTHDLVDGVDRHALVAMLREKDQHIQALEAECKGLADQLMAFQSEILKWVEFDR